MMCRRIFVFFSMLFFIASICLAEEAKQREIAKEIVVIGYQSGQVKFAGEVLEQAKLVIPLIKSIVESNPDKKVRIDIYGSADSIEGIVSQDDRLAINRANQWRDILQRVLSPREEVLAHSRGDREYSGQVRLVLIFTDILPVASPFVIQKKMEKIADQYLRKTVVPLQETLYSADENKWPNTVIIFFGALLGVFLFWMVAGKRKEKENPCEYSNTFSVNTNFKVKLRPAPKKQPEDPDRFYALKRDENNEEWSFDSIGGMLDSVRRTIQKDPRLTRKALKEGKIILVPPT